MLRQADWSPRGKGREAAAKPFVPPFENGDHLDQKTFHALYLQTPEGFKAELIGGIVYVASPVSFKHGRPHLRLATWLGVYVDDSPEVDGFDNTTTILGDKSEPQPDLGLFLSREAGGRVTEDEEGMLTGPADLLVEVANSSAAIDLHAKKQDYEEAGIREYVVALAKTKTVLWFARTRKGFVPLQPGPDGVFRSKVFPGLWLDPAGLFDKRPRRLLSVLRQGLASPEHAAFVAKLEAKAKKAKPKPRGDR